MGWSAVNLRDMINDVLPTVDEYNMYYDLGNDDVYYDDDREEEMNDDDVVLDSDIALGNDIKGDDNKVNATFQVPIASNYDVPFVSTGCEMGSVPIAPNAKDRQSHDPIRNGRYSKTTRARTPRVVSQPSTFNDSK